MIDVATPSLENTLPIRATAPAAPLMHEMNVCETPGWKRSLDIFLILLFLPLLLPLMAFIALLIASASSGPVLFRQERIGFRGRRFTCFKFRTMVAGNDPTMHQAHLRQLMASNRPLMKMDSAGDSRIIPGGQWLRATGLDELPQLLNVLRGEMSLVGPRPCVPYEFENYLDRQKARFNAVPGLTGLWQVSGKNKTTFERMIQLDIQYAKCPTLSGDVIILMKTPAVLAGQFMETCKKRVSGRANAQELRNPGVVACTARTSPPPAF